PGGPEPAYALTGQTMDLSMAALFGERAPPVRLTSDFTLVGSGTAAATATLRLVLAGQLAGWRADVGDAVNLELELDDGTLRLERGVLSLATLDLQAAGVWRFVPPASGELRYSLRVSDLAPFAPYLLLAAYCLERGDVWSDGTLSGPARRSRF